jgi:DNA gyrase subunit A
MADIDKDTVDFQPNYDEKELEPTVMPTRVPNLLVNGSSGIAVGMATNIPPHNLSEIIDATIALIDDPEIGIDGLMQHVPGPDFPTAGIINGAGGIHEAYRTGRGRIYVRAKAEIEVDEKTNREAIIVTELPYMVNKARLIEKIAELVKEKKLEGISELRDESDKDGMRVFIEIRRDAAADVVLNNLYQQTPMESVFGINMVCLLDGRPRLLNLKEMLEAFVRHRREVVTRRTIFELRRARDRAHILEGLTVALANIDEMIELIKTSSNPQEARERMLARRWEPGLVRALLGAAGADASRPEDLLPGLGLSEDGYQLSEAQAKDILEMRLHRLTGLEQEKLTDEYKKLLDVIAELIRILEDPERLLEVIRDELRDLKENFGDARRTVIQPNMEDLNILDLIAPEDVVVTLSHAGYVKRQPLSTYRAQKRGGRGRSATAMKEEDFIERLWVVNTHDILLSFTSSGRVFWPKVYQLPEAGPNARGRPMVNFVALEAGERIQAVLPVRDFPEGQFVLFATARGTVKKTPLKEFEYQLQRGKIAINLEDGDSLVGVALTDGESDVMLFASNGKVSRFDEGTVRPMGRTATGVIGMRLAEGESVVSLICVQGEHDVLTATANGFGKRTPLEDFPKKGRGTQGVIAIQTTDRNGQLVSAIQVEETQQVMLISDQGTLVRTRVGEIARVGRNTQGVTLIRLGKGEQLVNVDAVPAEEEEEVEPGAEAASADADAPLAADDASAAGGGDSAPMPEQ